jgi:hypothetical protein
VYTFAEKPTVLSLVIRHHITNNMTVITRTGERYYFTFQEKDTGTAPDWRKSHVIFEITLAVQRLISGVTEVMKTMEKLKEQGIHEMSRSNAYCTTQQFNGLLEYFNETIKIQAIFIGTCMSFKHKLLATMSKRPYIVTVASTGHNNLFQMVIPRWGIDDKDKVSAAINSLTGPMSVSQFSRKMLGKNEVFYPLNFTPNTSKALVAYLSLGGRK